MPSWKLPDINNWMSINEEDAASVCSGNTAQSMQRYQEAFRFTLSGDSDSYSRQPLATIVIEPNTVLTPIMQGIEFNAPLYHFRTVPYNAVKARIDERMQQGIARGHYWHGFPIVIDGILFGYVRNSYSRFGNQLAFSLQTTYTPVSLLTDEDILERYQQCGDDLTLVRKMSAYFDMCKDENFVKAFEIIDAIAEAMYTDMNAFPRMQGDHHYTHNNADLQQLLIEKLPHHFIRHIYPDAFVLNWQQLRIEALEIEYRVALEQYERINRQWHGANTVIQQATRDLKVAHAFNTREAVIDLETITNPHVSSLLFNKDQNAMWLVINTHDIYLKPSRNEVPHLEVPDEGINMGKYKIKIPLIVLGDDADINITGTETRIAFDDSPCCHPHVFRRGNVCFGGFTDAIAEYTNDMEIGGLVDVLIMFLQQADSFDSAGKHWPKWLDADYGNYYQESERDEQTPMEPMETEEEYYIDEND
jgi:hypothetical protein